MSEEQPAKIIDEKEQVKVTPSNTTDTLSIKQQRKEAADKLGISYKESLNMSLSDLQDPNYAFKQNLLEASNKIAEMQKEPINTPTPTEHLNPITKETAIANGVYFENMGPETKEQAIANGNYKEEKFNLYDKANAFATTALHKISEVWSGTPKNAKRSLAASAVFGYIYFRTTGLNAGSGIAHASAIDDTLDQIKATAEKAGPTGSTGSGTVNGMTQAEYVASGGGSYDPTAATGEAGATGVTTEVTGATGASRTPGDIVSGGGGATPQLPLYGEIDTPKPAGTVHKDTLANINNFEEHKHAGDTRGGQWVTGGLDENYRNMSPDELRSEITAKFINRPDVASKMLWVQDNGYNGNEMKSADPSLVQNADKMVTEGHANSYGTDQLAELRSKMSDHSFTIESSSNYQNLHNTGINKNGELTINPTPGFDSDSVIVERNKTNGETVAVYKIDKNDEGKDCANLLVKVDSQPSTPNGGIIPPEHTIPPHHNPPEDTPKKKPPTDQTPPTTPEEKPPGHTPKGPTHGAEDNTHQHGNNSEIHGNDGPEDQQQAGSGNNTNVDTGTSDNAANNGSGSSDTAPGNTTPADPDRDPSDAGQIPGAGSSNTNNGDPGQP